MSLVFIAGLVFFFWVYRLQTRIENLERTQNLRRDVPSVQPGPIVPTEEEKKRIEASTAGLAAAPGLVDTPVYRASVPTAPSSGTRFIEWLKKDFMVKLGAFLLLLALGWFVSYAIQNEWIGPMGQIVIGLLIGVSFMVLGVWRITLHPHQGGIFAVLGSTTILLTVWAAREIYDFFTPLTALFMMALSVVFVAFLSVRHNRRALALSGLVLAAVAPFLTNAPFPDLTLQFTYLTVVVLGTLWVVYLRGWSILTFAALIIVFLYGVPYLLFGTSSSDQDIALFFAFLFTAIFFVANILGLIANENEENRAPHLAIALGTGLYLIAWVTVAAEEHWQSLLYVAWMLVFSIGSFIVYRVIANRRPFYIYGGTSVALLAAATAAELSGPTLTIAFTLEVALLVVLSALLLKDQDVARKLALLFVGPIALSYASIESSAWYTGILHDDLFVIVILGLSLAVVGVLLRARGGFNESDKIPMILITIASLYGLSLIWLVLHAGTQLSPTSPYDYYGGNYRYYTDTEAYQQGTMFSLIIYALIGIALFIFGKQRGRRALMRAGGVLLGAVIVRLLLVEVWDMELVTRIITFMVIGGLLISTAFMRKRVQIEEHIQAKE